MGDEIQLRQGREGNRWFNERPDGDAVAKWFETALEMPEGLKHEHYVAGVTLIPGKEKSNEPRGFGENGFPLFTEVTNLVFTPYVKVETRVQFFHDLMEKHRDEWLGVIEPVEPAKPSATLPPGFSRISVANGDRATNFITCTMKVTVFKRSTVEWKEIVNQRTGEKVRVRVGETIIDPAPATKMVPTLSYGNADVHLLEKAETGAVGRALGMAGMLVVPGTGVATAEDMREVVDNEGVSPEGREERPPREGGAGLDAAAEPTHAELVTMAEAAITKLKGLDEPAFTLFLAWCKESGYSGKVSEMKDPDLKVVIRKAEREVEALEAKAAENG
jgi:hypothetical protein